MKKQRKLTIQQNEISKLVTYTLGGIEQKVLIDGRYKSNPIVIFLHGGPGTPLPFNEGCRGLFPEITEKATMVYWDQYGCGINNAIIPEDYDENTFATMTVDLIRQIKSDYPDNKIYLFGVSWGSILSLKATLAVPELIEAVVIYGQVIGNILMNDYVFDAIEKADMPEKKKKFCAEFKAKYPDVEPEDFTQVSGILRKYTDGVICKTSGKAPMGDIIRGILTSPDYRFKDFKAIMVNGYAKNQSVMNALTSIDTREELNSVTIPYYIFQGDKDLMTPTPMVEEFMQDKKNENLHFDVFSDAGHIPSGTAMDMLMDNIFKIINK